MTDVGFPIITYDRNQTPLQWGRQHGESYRTAIHELAEIRRDLMREKNPALDHSHIERLADEQWQASEKFNAALMEEMQGIADGADISRAELVILNNYTDFRDIQVDDQGCSLVYANQNDGPVVGQTWDMHGSAKRYVCVMEVPERDSDHRAIVFSIVGCTGMMGFTSRGTVMGVNNINTDKARASVIWPVLVREILNKPDAASMVRCLEDAPKTSGHNYLIAQHRHAEMWEVAPELSERVGKMQKDDTGNIFHTNHCLGVKMVSRESTISQTSTTHIRFDLLKKKVDSVSTLSDMFDLMNDHENYPKSICSNFQTDAQDPSITCGGAVGHLESLKVQMWRGDKVHDDNFVLHEFDLSNS